jgi:hypothetical protein
MARVGRPNKWEDCIDPAWDYVNGGFQQEGDVVPTIAGLSVCLHVARETIHAWARENEEFSHIVKALMGRQEKMLANGGILGEYNASITKLLLSKHGYSDKVETAHTGPDGGPVQIQEVKRTIVDPGH